MRQVTDLLVWLMVIVVVAAVVYFTPRLANYVRSRDSEPARAAGASRGMAYQWTESTDATP